MSAMFLIYCGVTKDATGAEKALKKIEQLQDEMDKNAPVDTKEQPAIPQQPQSEICPKCENPYPHSHKDGGFSCEECNHVW